MEKMYIGIDPGQAGGFGIIKPDGSMAAVKMPETEHDINNIFYHIKKTHAEIFCMIEKVGVMPGQGVSSSGKFMKGYGFLRGCLVANKIPFKDVLPRAWQKGLGVVARKKTETKTQHKNKLKALAQQLHPEMKVTLAIADGILIAEYVKLLNK